MFGSLLVLRRLGPEQKEERRLLSRRLDLSECGTQGSKRWWQCDRLLGSESRSGAVVDTGTASQEASGTGGIWRSGLRAEK